MWFNNAFGKFSFKKYNEEIIINEFVGDNDEVVTDKEYLSLIAESENCDMDIILDKFQQIKNHFTEK